MIVHVVSYDVSRGAERYARDLVDNMNRRGLGHHVLMTMFQGDESGLNPDVALEVPRGWLRRLGFDPRVISRMRRALVDLAPKAIVAHGGEPAKYAALASRRTIPYVYLVIGSSHPLLRSRIRRWIRDFYVSRASAVVGVSTGLSAEMREAGVPERKLHVIPNGRDPKRYRVGQPSSTRSPRVLFVGHLDEQKRPDLFISVMEEMSRRGCPARGVMIGGGPLIEDVRERARQVGVEVLGPRDDVPDLLASGDLLVMTSRPPEGMPGVLIEAGMAGLAVVTTNVPGARDVVVDDETGLVVDVTDTAGLFDAVEALLRDEPRRREMGRAARERCVTEFSLDTSADRWHAVLSAVKT